LSPHRPTPPNYHELQIALVYDLERRGLLDGASFVPRTVWPDKPAAWFMALMMLRSHGHLVITDEAAELEASHRTHQVSYTGQLEIRAYLHRQRHLPDRETGFGEGS
jgi:hypothetical protein